MIAVVCDECHEVMHVVDMPGDAGHPPHVCRGCEAEAEERSEQ